MVSSVSRLFPGKPFQCTHRGIAADANNPQLKGEPRHHTLRLKAALPHQHLDPNPFQATHFHLHIVLQGGRQVCLTEQIQKHEAFNVAVDGYAADHSRISHSSFGFSAVLIQKNSPSGSTSIVRLDTA
jgi:hypothetical protein